MTNHQEDCPKKLQLGRYIKLAVLSLVLAGVLVLTLRSHSQASSASQPQWAGLAGLANHACYHHKGVRQVFADGASDVGGIGDYTAVCIDGWAMALPINDG